MSAVIECRTKKRERKVVDSTVRNRFTLEILSLGEMTPHTTVNI
jgi:hypothetical protein